MERPTEVAELDAGRVEYRFERRYDRTVVVFHGGHLRAGLALGEDVFEALGYSVLVPSRPGYGRTPVVGRGSPAVFADTTAELCAHLGIGRVAAVVAVSAGGRTGLAMARRHPDLVASLILEAAVGFEPWPDKVTRASGRLLFNPATEGAVWALVHTMMRRAPDVGLRAMMSSLSTTPPEEVIGGLAPVERATLVDLFARMRSGHGFANDLRWSARPVSVEISQPTLVLASASDATVPLRQAEVVADRIAGAQLVVTGASSHFLWFGPGADEATRAVRTFLEQHA